MLSACQSLACQIVCLLAAWFLIVLSLQLLLLVRIRTRLSAIIQCPAVMHIEVATATTGFHARIKALRDGDHVQDSQLAAESCYQVRSCIDALALVRRCI